MAGLRSKGLSPKVRLGDSSPADVHLSEEGLPCSGVFLFERSGPERRLVGVRVCKSCGRRETYEHEVVFVAAKEGVTTGELRDICGRIFELLKDQLSKVGISKNAFDDRLFVYIAEESSRSVALFTYPFPDLYADVQSRFEEIVGVDMDLLAEFRRCVAMVFRKPVAHDRLGKRVVYNDKVILRSTIASV